MKNQKDIVDKALEALKKERAEAEPPTDVVDTTLGMLAEQEDELQQEEFKKRVRIVRIIESAGRFTKAAAAAGIIIAVLIGIIFFSKLTEGPKPAVIGQTETDRQGPVTEPAEQTKTKPTPEATVEAQLEQIRQMVEAGDTAGLIELLQKGPLESKIAATYYLGSIGDIETLSALEQISKQQGPRDPNNLFITAALEKIESRLGIKEPAPQPSPSIKITQQKEDFNPSGILSGLVIDAATGEPIRKAEVRASKGRTYTEMTDANGFYRFEEIEEAGYYRIGVWSDAHIGIYDLDKMPVLRLSNDTQAVKHFELEPACTLEVRVVNEDDEPVEDVRLTATSLAYEHGRSIGDRLHSQKTDANGIMLLGGFKPLDTPYLITAVHQRQVRSKGDKRRWQIESDYAPGKLLVTLNRPGVIDYGEIVLEKGVAVKGYAEYADGVPVEGLEIGAKPDWWHRGYIPGSPIDANGYFRLEQIVPGTYSIEIHIPIGADMTMVPTVMQTRLPLEEGLLIVKLPQKSPGSLVSISGTIIFVGDKKPHRIEVSAYSRESGHHHVNLSSEQDTFTIDSLEPGLHRLTFSGSNVEQKVIENVKAPSEGLEVELRYAAKPRLRGTVVRADTGEPVKQFRVRARKLKILRGPNYSQRDRWTEFRGTNGHFDIEAVGPGVYQVHADAEGFAPTWSDEINTDVNEPALIELSAGGSIKGAVTDENGEPVSGAKVIPLSKAGRTPPRAEDTFVSENGAVETVNGEFILERLPAGKETIRVTHPGYSFEVVKDIEVIEGRVTEGIQITLAKGGAAEGYVYDSQGLPQANVTLFFQDASGYGGSGDEQTGRFATAVTDSNGFYYVEGLPEKMCYIRRSDSTSHLGVVRRTFLPTNRQTSRLDFGGEPVVSGQLVIDGEPLANTKMQLGSVENRGSGFYTCYALTESEGQFKFIGVPAGRHAIYYQRPQKRNEWLKVANIDVGREDMELGIIPELSSTLSVYIESDSNDPNLAVSQLYIQEGTKSWGQRAGEVIKPVAAGESYMVTGIIPGKYTVIALRADNVMIRQQIDVAEEDHEVTMQITKGTCSLAGKIFGGVNLAMIWREDRKVVAYLKPDADGNFKTENLPAGEYLVGGNMMLDIGVLLRFNLSEGESKLVDVDTSNFSNLSLSTLIIQVLTENGVPITGTDIWLESDDAVIEPVGASAHEQYFLAEPGEYTLHAAYPGFKEVAQPVLLKQKDMTKVNPKDSVTFIRLEKE